MTVDEKQLSLWDYGYELVIVFTTFIFIYKYYKNKKKVRYEIESFNILETCV